MFYYTFLPQSVAWGTGRGRNILFYSSRQEYSFNVISINLLQFITLRTYRFSFSTTMPPKPSFQFNARGQFSIIYLLWKEQDRNNIIILQLIAWNVVMTTRHMWRD